MVENQVFESLPQCVIHKNNNSQDWFCKRKVSFKKVMAEKPQGRADLPFPRATRVKAGLISKSLQPTLPQVCLHLQPFRDQTAETMLKALQYAHDKYEAAYKERCYVYLADMAPTRPTTLGMRMEPGYLYSICMIPTGQLDKTLQLQVFCVC